ncbi:cell division protein ZapD [Salinisphaera sp. Q1T1-3]|uniref:cell division protein ZapD n=1 Tax=Salinisphaera sp. Q1T1-3 TaxID=2321229 RepID=UPI00131482A8|nr:cell division protein ZapD [Salinisphaera sp. Q1T1-3]
MGDDGLLCYEQPLNERVRTFLRLEHLTARFHYHAADHSFWGRRATVDAVLDLLNIMSRHDIRGEVSRALVHRRGTLAQLADRDDVDGGALARVLAELDAVSDDMARIPPQFSSYLLRDNELLASVNNRSAIAGGTCSFDLPGYRHWLAQPAARLDADIAAWMSRVSPIENGVTVLLRLLRDAGEMSRQTAGGGVYLHNTAPGTQLIRVMLDAPSVFPEISAGRHRATVRFMSVDPTRGRVRQTDQDISFGMACCRF